MKSRTLRGEVIAAARLAEESAAIQTHVGGGMHPKSSQLWAFFLALQNAYGVAGDLMEIGVFKGWGSYLPARYCRSGERLILVDISVHYLQESKAFLVEKAGIDAASLDLVQVDSVFTEGLSRALGGSRRLRFAHIDGEHSYGAVMADLDTAVRYALPESIVVVDDVDLAHSTCINDGLHDWLARNSSWRLLVRGYNKAYLVSTRSRIPWRRHVDFLPEVFRRHFRTEVMIASQTHSADTDYFAVGDPVGGNSYQIVGRTMAALETFEAYNPRAALLGLSGRPMVALCGDEQMAVLARALSALAAECGMDVHFEHVGSTAAARGGSDERMRMQLHAAIGMVVQQSWGDEPPLAPADTLRLYGLGWLIPVPTLRFDGYWPNLVSLIIEPGSESQSAVDAVAWDGAQRRGDDAEIAGRLMRPDLYEASAVSAWAERAVHMLRDHEQAVGTTVGLASVLAAGLTGGGRRLFHTPTRPAKRLMDALALGLLKELTAVFEPRYRDRCDELASGSVFLHYDISPLNCVDEPPLPCVSHALGLAGEIDEPGVCRYVHDGNGNGIHARVTWLQEIAGMRAKAQLLDAQARDANLRSMAAQRVLPTL